MGLPMRKNSKRTKTAPHGKNKKGKRVEKRTLPGEQKKRGTKKSQSEVK